MVGAEHASVATVAGRAAGSGEVSEVVVTLAAAFHDDPVVGWLFPDPARRRELLPPCFELDVRAGLQAGLVDTVDGCLASAVWARSPGEPGSEGAVHAYVEAYVATAQEAGARVAALFEFLGERQAPEPHLSLELIGARPDSQGHGLGAVVLRSGLARCDQEGVPAHLWSSNPRNLPFYRRHGFEVVGEFRVPGGPPVWTMERRPRLR